MNLGRIGKHLYELHVLGEEHAVSAALTGAGFPGLKLSPRSSPLGAITVIEIEDGGFTDLREVGEFLRTTGFSSEIMEGHK